MTKEKGKGKIKKEKLKVEELSEADVKAQMAIGEGKVGFLKILGKYRGSPRLSSVDTFSPNNIIIIITL